MDQTANAVMDMVMNMNMDMETVTGGALTTTTSEDSEEIHRLEIEIWIDEGAETGRKTTSDDDDLATMSGEQATTIGDPAIIITIAMTTNGG